MTTPLGWNSVQMDHSRGNTPERLLLHRCRALTLGFREPGMYRSMVLTVAGDDLLTIEIYAYSTEGLQQMAASLQTMAIPDKEP
ncbi:MAG: hypothetical protein DMG42_11835 [Acidobacteria bacterium]|nr:MAG: hypothetical protein DMG42_11835 [Acidobacteriota bacterium]